MSKAAHAEQKARAFIKSLTDIDVERVTTHCANKSISFALPTDFDMNMYDNTELLKVITARLRAACPVVKFEKFDDHHGDQYAWNFSGKRVWLRQWWSGESEMGLIQFDNSPIAEK